MPKIPGYEGSQSVSTQQGARVDPREAGQAAREMQRAGAGLVSLSGELAKTQDAWDKAKSKNQYTIARNDRKGAIAEFMSRVDAETDHTKAQEYAEELEKLRGQEVEFDDDNIRALNASDSDLEFDMAELLVTKAFRGKMTSFERAEIAKDGIDTAEDYASESDPVYLMYIKAAYKDRLTAGKEAGYLTDAEYLSEMEGMKDWEYNRALKAIGSDPRAALEMLHNGEFDIKDTEKKMSAESTANAAIKRNAYLSEVVKLETQVANQAELSRTIYGAFDPQTGTRTQAFDPQTGTDSRGKSISEKITEINRKEGLGEISEKFATKARRYLTGVKKQVSVATGFEFARVLRLVSSANARHEGGIDSGDDIIYMKKIMQIQGDVMDSNLPDEEKLLLLNTIATRTSKKQAEALVSISSEEPYSKADKYFNEHIPMWRDQAFTEYFKQYHKETKNGQPLSDKMANKMKMNIMQKIQFRGNKNFIKSIRDTNERYPNALYVEPDKDPKTGELFLKVAFDKGYKKVPLTEYGALIEEKNESVSDQKSPFGPRMMK